MARGNCTLVTSVDHGREEEGFVKAGQTLSPGMIALKDPSVALKGGRHTFKPFDIATGTVAPGNLWVVTEKMNAFRGKGMADAYNAGDRVSLYSPKPGEEFNLVIANLAGTADDHPLGEALSVNTSGKMIVAASITDRVAILLEAIVDPTVDTIAWCEWGS